MTTKGLAGLRNRYPKRVTAATTNRRSDQSGIAIARREAVDIHKPWLKHWKKQTSSIRTQLNGMILNAIT